LIYDVDDRFVLQSEEFIQSGHYSDVWMITDEQGRKTAVKRFNPRCSSLMVHKECAILLSLQQFKHPNVLRVLQACPEERSVTTEFCARGELFEFIKMSHGGLSEICARIAFKQLLTS